VSGGYRAPMAVLDHEPELGQQRYCRRCEEWWPFTAEFWRPVRTTWTCRACQREWNRLWGERNIERRRYHWRETARRARSGGRHATRDALTTDSVTV
jgi:hypothetical protein